MLHTNSVILYILVCILLIGSTVALGVPTVLIEQPKGL